MSGLRSTGVYGLQVHGLQVHGLRSTVLRGTPIWGTRLVVAADETALSSWGGVHISARQGRLDSLRVRRPRRREPCLHVGMGRDVRKLEVFRRADVAAEEVYGITDLFPDRERYALALQMRRAAISVPANLVEGAERYTEKDFLRHVDIAAGSAAEARYLLGFSRRLRLADQDAAARLEADYDGIVRALHNLRAALRRGGP